MSDVGQRPVEMDWRVTMGDYLEEDFESVWTYSR